MEFPRQEYWSGLPFPSSGDLLDPGIEPRSPALHVNSLPSKPPGKPLAYINRYIILQRDEKYNKISMASLKKEFEDRPIFV